MCVHMPLFLVANDCVAYHVSTSTSSSRRLLLKFEFNEQYELQSFVTHNNETDYDVIEVEPR